ncbi:uncharacterized protein LOC126416588 [Schistocerca serialis cubense]|uniref:uncharacterized protein LOC126416588 n=1 Tax=Schistocerca serialis cubense TaxID=2023355 RepID=UPI00214F2056|nr:uncharacterized protein LOC126416588 [Schistocerca serialis cubense]
MSIHGGSESVLDTTTKAAAEPQIATASRSNSVTTATPEKPATSEPAQATRPITAAAQATEAEMVSTIVAVPLQSLAEKGKETTGISNYRAKPTDTTTTDPTPTEIVPIKESKHSVPDPSILKPTCRGRNAPDGAEVIGRWEKTHAHQPPLVGEEGTSEVSMTADPEARAAEGAADPPGGGEGWWQVHGEVATGGSGGDSRTRSVPDGGSGGGGGSRIRTGAREWSWL